MANIVKPPKPCWEQGVEGGRTRPINRESLRQILRELHAECEAAKITPILILGTLLGVIREGDLLAHDDDADVALLMPERHLLPKLINGMRARGFVVPPGNAKPADPVVPESTPYYDTTFIRDGEKVEAWWFDPVSGGWAYDPIRCKDKRAVVYAAKYFDNPAEVSYLGLNWFVPNPPEDWLAETYGPTWKTPIVGKKPVWFH